MSHPQNWSTTERDADRYERRYAPDWYDPRAGGPGMTDVVYSCCRHCACEDRSGHAQPCVGCQVVREDDDRRAARAMNDAGHVATALVLAFCIAGSIAFLLVLKYVGQPVMCKWSNQPKPSYCATAVQR